MAERTFVKVHHEYYRVRSPSADPDENKFISLREGYRRAYSLLGQPDGPLSVVLERVTVHDPIPDVERDEYGLPTTVEGLFREPRTGSTETVTAYTTLSHPHLSGDPQGRYHPVNGWVVPEVLEV